MGSQLMDAGPYGITVATKKQKLLEKKWETWFF